MKVKKLALLLNLLIIAAILILNYFYQSNHFNFTLKCICSTGFALLGIINLGYAIGTKQENIKFFVLMAMGLMLAMLGDVFINKNFIVTVFYVCGVAGRPGKQRDCSEHGISYSVTSNF